MERQARLAKGAIEFARRIDDRAPDAMPGHTTFPHAKEIEEQLVAPVDIGAIVV